MKKFWVVVDPFSAGHGVGDYLMETDAVRHARYISSTGLADYERSRPEIHHTREDALADLRRRAESLEDQARRLRVDAGGADPEEDVPGAWMRLLDIAGLHGILSLVRQDIEASNYGDDDIKAILRENTALQQEIAKIS